MIGLHPETTRLEHDPATGEAYVACTPLPLDVAVVHASEGDSRGNVRVDPKLVWMDAEVCRAAATTIVTVERTVPESALRRRALAHDLSALHGRRRRRGAVGRVPDVVLSRSTATTATSSAPTSRRTPTRPEARRLWSERIDGPESHGAFLDANGGAATLLGIAGSRS